MKSTIALIALISIPFSFVLAQQNKRDAEIEKLKKDLKAANERAMNAEAMAEKYKKLAETNEALAKEAETKALQYRYIALAKVLARISTEMDDSVQLQAKTAQLAYKFYMRNLGFQKDDDIYQGLYHALERFKDPIIGEVGKQVWPSNVSMMSASLCRHINSNMSEKQWRIIVSPDLPYETLCDK